MQLRYPAPFCMEEQVKRMNEWGQVVQLLLLKEEPHVWGDHVSAGCDTKWDLWIMELLHEKKEFISGAVKAFWGIKHLLIPCAENPMDRPFTPWEFSAKQKVSDRLGTTPQRPCYTSSSVASVSFLRYEKVPVILVGNKVDLESEREVSSSEGQALAEEWGCPFMETSAKSKTMVDELFAEIVRQMDYAAQPDKDDPCCSSCNIQ